MTTPTLTSRKVAVIGAGPSGLVSARELRREGHIVTIFERQGQIGGTWVYTSEAESDPMSVDPNRTIIHSSIYKSLRTNLCREVMGFRDYPFIPKNDKTKDPRRYPCHEEMLLYLQDFVKEFEIEEMARFDTEVVHVAQVEDSNKWKVKFRKNGCDFNEEIYDAVVVCVGANTEPRIADLPGISSWPGKQMHSHNYRVTEPFQDQVVIVIGRSASSADLSRDIAKVAKEVHITCRSVADETYEEEQGYDNMWLHSMIESVHEDGSVVFRNGRVVHTDIILHCTGYAFYYPFLDTKGIVTVDDNRVGPLYKHVFPPALAPWLSFVELPTKAMPLLIAEYQSKWIAGVLSGRIKLPSQEEMMEDIESFYASLEASNVPKRYTHEMYTSQFEYYDWIASQCGCQALEEWREPMFFASMNNAFQRTNTFRDEWKNDEHLILQATEYFTKMFENKTKDSV